jgi:hypothetical protein
MSIDYDGESNTTKFIIWVPFVLLILIGIVVIYIYISSKQNTLQAIIQVLLILLLIVCGITFIITSGLIYIVYFIGMVLNPVGNIGNSGGDMPNVFNGTLAIGSLIAGGIVGGIYQGYIGFGNEVI